MKTAGPSYKAQTRRGPFEGMTSKLEHDAFNKPINWHLYYREAITAAKHNSQIWAPGGGAGLLLIYFGGSDWCQPCKNLDAEIYEDHAFRTWFNMRPWVPLHIDYTINSPQPPDLQIQMAELWEKYNVNQNDPNTSGFPTILAVDANGLEIDRIEGYTSGTDPMQFAQYLKDAFGVV